jgi:hypothetical protein
MASFHTKTFTKHDDYMTPKYAWENIQHLIPRDKVIWEAFYGNGESGTFLQELGFDTIHEDVDFFTHDLGDIIVSNPPFSISKDVVYRLKALDKPFIIIMPCSKISTQYFRESFKNTDIQIIIPRRRIHFKKLVNGEVPEGWKDQCNFDCFYYCYKMGFTNSIMWLE